MSAARPTQQPAVDGSRSMRALMTALGAIERVGNRLPHPFWLFTGLAVVVLLLSSLLGRLGVSAVNPADGEELAVVDLLTADGLRRIIDEAVTNFVTFPPLGLIIAVMLGVAVAEHSGLLSALLRGSVTRVPAKWLTFTLALAGVTGSVASDAIYVVLIPLGALAFKAVGRSPVLGLVVAFASASAGYNASLLITGTDAVLAGLTTSAAQLVDEDYVVTPVANYFFSAASAVLLAAVVTLVTEKLLVRRAADLEPDADADADAEGEAGGMASMHLTAVERRGVRNAGLAMLAVVVVIGGGLAWPGSPLRGEDGGVLSSPVLSGIAAVLGVVFALVGVAYGRTVGSIRAARDVPAFMARGVAELAPVLVLFFAAAQFIAYFSWSNIGPVLAVSGAEALDSLGVPQVLLFAGVVLIATTLNLLITSGSAEWTLLAPVLVPMMMLLSVPPETTQMLFRIADSPTNIITPMSPYFVLALGYLQQYRRSAGIGTLISFTLPISVVVLISWFAFFLLWWAIGIPLGPGVPVR